MAETYDFSMINTYLNISPEGAERPLAEMPAAELPRDESRVKEMLRITGEKLRAFDLTMPGSFLGASICHLCVTKLAFLAQYGVMLDLSLERLTLQVDYNEQYGYASFRYRIDDVRTRDIPAEGGDADVVRDWERFIAASAVPAVETIARTAGLKPEMIWHQFGSYIPLMRNLMKEANLPEETLARLEHQIVLLTERIPPETFRQRRHPFVSKVRYVENYMKPGEFWVMRSSCCLYDRREGGEKCYVCPRRTETERAEMKQRLLAGIAARSE